jgi:ATP-dependent helicase HrpB
LILPDLPILEVLPPLRHHLERSAQVILSAPPGSGKTSLVPLALMDEPWLAGRSIIMLEPRRLATRLSAQRMADLLGERPGETVGYRIRHEARVSPRTRIAVVTEGILTRRLQQDPELAGVGLLIFDEFHERNLHTDLALALALDCSAAFRPDLRILLMSATLDGGALSAFLEDAPLVRGEGRSYPVGISYLSGDSDRSPSDRALSGVVRALAERTGDILVFLPGVGEIRRLATALEGHVATDCRVLPLYADLTREQQDLALLPDPSGRRRLVLATRVAETSLTIEGIDTVVDLGLSRLPRFDPGSGLSRLLTCRCSQAAADQRAGRAGRLGPGHCYRLWSEARHRQLPAHSPVEIANADLAPLVLDVACWGLSTLEELRWLEPPPAAAVAQARSLLCRLGLLDAAHRLTARGDQVAQLGLHPRLGCLMLRGEQLGAPALAADLAALLSERDILRGVDRPVDLLSRIECLQAWREGRLSSADVDIAACRAVDRLARQLRKGRRQRGAAAGVDPVALLLAAYPDRLAMRSGARDGRYRLAFAGAVRLPHNDALQRSEFLLVAELDAGQREGRIYRALALSPQVVQSSLENALQWRTELSWQTDRVVARRLQYYGELVLQTRAHTEVDAHDLCATLCDAIAASGLDLLPWNEAARQLQARILSLRHWQPQSDWPDLSDAALLTGLDHWLLPWVQGISRLDQLQRLDMKRILTGLLDWPRQQQLERLAPGDLKVPSGSRKRLCYRAGEAPVLAVRLQELFGLVETPRVCDGQVRVMLHLLSPAQRPIQVTRDLRGFWQHTYADVKKELKGRYPKHYWPDNPFEAVPTSRTRPR